MTMDFIIYIHHSNIDIEAHFYTKLQHKCKNSPTRDHFHEQMLMFSTNLTNMAPLTEQKNFSWSPFIEFLYRQVKKEGIC